MNKRTMQSLILGIAIGVAVGLGINTFVYAKRATRQCATGAASAESGDQAQIDSVCYRQRAG